MLIKFVVVADIPVPGEGTGENIAAAMKEHIEKTSLDELDYYIEAF